uniref:sigma factor-like helix-turn-helix DNA-binding protein n=1 Tax=Vallitalea okinawensis TaxID=2078660 RepID=UPI001FA85D00
MWIANELLMMLRSDKKQKNEVSLQEPIGIDKEANAITLNDILKYDNESVLDQVDIKMKIRQLYEKMKEVLKARDQMVLEMRYGLKNGVEKTQREVAQELGISRSYVSRI